MGKNVYALDGKIVKEIELDNSIFNVEINKDAIYFAVNHELANKRVGTASAKTRAEVHGSNKKPWAQKHTGRAASGDVKSPIWRKGGVIFPPKPRDFGFKLSKRMKRLAIKSLLSLQMQNDDCKILEDFTVENGKTKEVLNILSRFFDKKASSQIKGEASKNQHKYQRTLVVLKDEDVKMKRALRNLPWVNFLTYNRLSAKELFYSSQVVFLETAITNLTKMYSEVAQ